MEIETPAMRRKRRDHERYMRQREMRLKKQKEYYRTHKEQVKRKVRECERNRIAREVRRTVARVA